LWQIVAGMQSEKKTHNLAWQLVKIVITLVLTELESSFWAQLKANEMQE
jgi:hypothetical protein